ncbi:hypothetical protein ACJ73_04879, partial [Blastomyces percursus]
MHLIEGMVDSGCAPYGIISSRLANRLKLQRIQFSGKLIEGFDGKEQTVTEMACMHVDVEGHMERNVYMYVVRTSKSTAEDTVILGMPWMKSLGVILNSGERTLQFRTGHIVKERRHGQMRSKISQMSAVAFATLKRKKGTHVFAASLADIEKALRVKKHVDPKTKLPEHYHEFLDVFDRKIADSLSPLRGPGIDHGIELEKINGKEAQPPWGALYNMTRDELLVLRK